MRKLIAGISSFMLVLGSLVLMVPAAQAATIWDVTGSYDVAFTCAVGCPAGPYVHDMDLVQDSLDNLTGTGGHPANGVHVYEWVLTSGSVSGNTLAFTANYTATPDAVTPQTVMNVSGTIAPDGSMSGTWTDNYQAGTRGGTWETVAGTASKAAYDSNNRSMGYYKKNALPSPLCEGYTVASGVGPFAQYESHSGNVGVAGAADVPSAVNADDSGFVQLDQNTVVVMKFASPVSSSGTSATDLRIYTVDDLFPADAEISVSTNGVSYTSVGVYSDADPDTNVDINVDAYGVSSFQYVKIDQGLHSIDPAFPTLGFDLDAVSSLTNSSSCQPSDLTAVQIKNAINNYSANTCNKLTAQYGVTLANITNDPNLLNAVYDSNGVNPAYDGMTVAQLVALGDAATPCSAPGSNSLLPLKDAFDHINNNMYLWQM